MEKQVAEKLKAHGYAIYYSLSHSDVRATVLLGLKHAGGKATLAELSENTGIGYTNVKRAVFDHGYSKNLSLITTGLVTAEAVVGTDTQVIVLTGKGREAVKALEDNGFKDKRSI